MKKKRTISLLILVSAMSGTGCGRVYTGAYTGSGTTTVNGMSLPPVQLTMSLSETNGAVTGTLNGSGGTTTISGSIQGHPSSTGQGLDSSIVTLTSPLTVGSQYTTGMNGMNTQFPNTMYPNPMYPTTGYPNAGMNPMYPTTGYGAGMNGVPGMPATGCTQLSGPIIIDGNKNVNATLTFSTAGCAGSLIFTGKGY